MGYVYFFQARYGSLLSIKIGRTHECPLKRLKRVSRDVPNLDSLTLIGIISTPNPKADEQKYQKPFAHLRIDPEYNYTRPGWQNAAQGKAARRRGMRDWFRLQPELAEFISQNAEFHICDRNCHRRSPGDVIRQQQVEAYRQKLQNQVARKVRAYDAQLRSPRGAPEKGTARALAR